MNQKPGSPVPSVLVIGNGGRVFNFPFLKDEITIGRSKENDIVLADQTVSRYHARIISTEDGFALIDLGSFNGTKVNGKSVQNAVLKHQDELKIGLAKMIFLTREENSHPAFSSLVITTDTDFEKGRQQIVGSSPEEPAKAEPHTLLIALPSQKSAGNRALLSGKREIHHSKMREEISNLERSNKVLFVLYEISRHLHTITDFNDLLNKMMDLILLVIDADYGYLILMGEEKDDEYIPVVVKAREEGTRPLDLKASRTIIRRVIEDKVALLTSNATADSRLDHSSSLYMQQVKPAMCVPLRKKDKIIGVIQLDSLRADNQFNEDDLEILKTIANQMAMVIEQANLNQQIREEERMRSRLERFHSPQVIEMILKGGPDTKDNLMEAKDLTATVLFADINGFTRLSEQMPPREVTMILNQYFSRMTDIIFKFDGTLDKYIGDGLMAVFGAPMEKKDDPRRAVLTALEMKSEVMQMMEQLEPEKRFTIRIGINTGRVVAGNIGSPRRMDYTVIGDAVNVASRLESMAQPNQILIGETTFRLVRGEFNINEVGPRKVKGRTSEIMVYEVLQG
jgi:adenylate cyclase